MTGAIMAVQARIGELRQLVERPTLVATAATTRSMPQSFDAALTAATGAQTAASNGVPTRVPTGAPVTGQDLVASATKYLGVPYVWGGESLDEGGLDCSGLVQRALADLGVTDVPRVARQQMTLGTAVPSLDQALPGDLVVFGGGSHIGIYVGDGQMIDAPKPGKAVIVRDVYTEPTAIRRILPQAGEPAAATTGTGAPAAATTGTAAPAGPTAADAGAAVAAAQRAAMQALAGLNAATGATS